MADLYNASANIVGDGYDSILYAGGQVKNAACSIDFSYIFFYFFIPLLIMLLFILLIKFSIPIQKRFYRIFLSGGYIKIMYIMPNKSIKFKLKKLDKFNTFNFKSKKYSLERMFNFIVGYDKYGFPIFMYDNSFILPLKITKKKLNTEIKNQIKDVQHIIDLKEQQDMISAFTMSIEPEILKTVYDKKLMSDLYSISGDDSFKKTLIWIGLIIALLLILYYTGLLEKIFLFLGIDVNM